MQPMRCLHAPTNIANQAWAAVTGLRGLGHQAEVWHYGDNHFSFRADRSIENATDPAVIMRTFREALDADFDVFHFHFARSLVPARDSLPSFWDLPVLRALDKRIVFTFHGTDVRLRSVHMDEDPWSYFRFADVPCDEELIASRLDIIRAHADHLIVANPLNRMFVPEAHYVPKIIDLEQLEPGPPATRRDPLIVHVPSRRATKGTEFVLKGMSQLEEQGHRFEFRLAESLSHDELLALFREADVVVDNLLLGDCEVTALEAMALAKPVVTRVRDEVLEHHPDLPAVRADPDTFVAQMEQVLADADERLALGARGREYVERTHAAPVVAEQLVALYQQAGKGTRVTFPGWPQRTPEDRVAKLEQRVLDLEAREGAMRRAAETAERRAEALRQKVEILEGRPEVRAAKALRGAVGRARKRRG